MVLLGLPRHEPFEISAGDVERRLTHATGT
jgi:hypothetical protein